MRWVGWWLIVNGLIIVIVPWAEPSSWWLRGATIVGGITVSLCGGAVVHGSSDRRSP